MDVNFPYEIKKIKISLLVPSIKMHHLYQITITSARKLTTNIEIRYNE